MGYRDELAAARRRIADLEATLSEERAALERDEPVAALRARVAALEDELAALTAAPTGWRAWARYGGAPLAGAFVYAVAFLYVTSDLDTEAWVAANLSIGVMIAGPVLAGARRSSMAWLGTSFLAFLVPWVWGRGWWTLDYAALPRGADAPSFGFFWYAPLTVAVLTAVAGGLIRFAERRAAQRAQSARASGRAPSTRTRTR